MILAAISEMAKRIAVLTELPDVISVIFKSSELYLKFPVRGNLIFKHTMAHRPELCYTRKQSIRSLLRIRKNKTLGERKT